MVMLPESLPGQDATFGSDRWNRAALEWVGLLKGGSFQEAGSRVDPAVPEGAMGPEQLEAIWAQISAQLGVLQSVVAGPVSEQGGYHVVDLPAAFESQSLVLRVVLTDSLLVSGFFIRPSEPPPYDPPAYVAKDRFEEFELTVGSDPWTLPGVLTLPKGGGPFPVVVLVHGSGPNDRDETIGGNRPFRDLAWGLASSGVAVLRYDKRTKVYGTRLPADLGLEDEVVSDALSALGIARNRPEVDPKRVFLLGHSLGGMMAPEIARRDGALAGIAVLAAPARPFFDVLTSQLEHVASLEPDAGSLARTQLDSMITAVKRIEAGDIPPGEVVLGAPPRYWKELAGVDPVAVAQGVSAPLFVLQGGRDYQSTPEDLALWEERLGAKEGFSAKLYPALNHLFAPGTGTATPEEYVSGIRHVDEEVIRNLADWVHRIGG
jgi:dienelactone hydrolase